MSVCLSYMSACLSFSLPTYMIFYCSLCSKVDQIKTPDLNTRAHMRQNIQIESSSSLLLISSWLAPYSAQSEDTQSKVVSSNFSKAPACCLAFQLPSLKHISLSVSSNWHCVVRKNPAHLYRHTIILRLRH